MKTRKGRIGVSLLLAVLTSCGLVLLLVGTGADGCGDCQEDGSYCSADGECCSDNCNTSRGTATPQGTYSGVCD